jgi:L-lactate permease
MKKIKSLFKNFVAVLVVMLGAYLTGFYMTTEPTITSVFCGVIGLIILYPAVKKWEETIWGKRNSEGKNETL